MLHEKFHNPRIVREDIRWPRFDFGEHLRMEVFDGIRHAAMFSHLRTRVKPQIVKPNAPPQPRRILTSAGDGQLASEGLHRRRKLTDGELVDLDLGARVIDVDSD